jgi:hypothetical protein
MPVRFTVYDSGFMTITDIGLWLLPQPTHARTPVLSISTLQQAAVHLSAKGVSIEELLIKEVHLKYNVYSMGSSHPQ